MNGPRRTLPLWKRCAFSILIFVICYGVAETVCTLSLGGRMHGRPWIASSVKRLAFKMIWPPGTAGSTSFWIAEKQGGLCFDPLSGYRLSSTPARFARVTNGEVEYVGAFRGNAQGFQDEHDFTIEKPAGIKWRAVVFGDSFTTGAFLPHNWPDRVEREAPGFQLLNFGVDGAGLANWWSVLTRIVIHDGYKFDALLFASTVEDLKRRFVVCEHRGYSRSMFGYCGWEPEKFPRNFDEARPYLTFETFLLVSPSDFDASLSAHRLQYRDKAVLEPPRSSQKVLSAARLPPAAATRFFSGEQMSLLLDMRKRIADRHVLVAVLYIPGRDELLQHRDESASVRAFAEILQARFVNGIEAFRDLAPAEIRASYFPYDAHWNQTGSGHFARLVESKIDAWQQR